jgi:hypothetical protein
MKRLFHVTTILALSCCATAQAITLDGLDIPSEAWSLKATQNSPTQFGNNPGGNQGSPGGSELNQIFAITVGNKLQIGITGNLEQNNNKLYIFLDGEAGGENVLAADNVDGPEGSTQIGTLANRITFPAGVTMDHGLKIELSAANSVYNVNYFNLINNTFINVATGSGVSAMPLVDVGGPAGIRLGWDNTNGAGVSNIDATTANTATSGWEFEIDLPTAFNGVQGNVNIVALISGDNGAFLSNQSLPGLNSPTNIGGGSITYTQVISVPTITEDPDMLGDVNGDDLVDLVDFGFIRTNWLATAASLGRPIVRGDGDLNGNGVIDIRDFREWKQYSQVGAAAIEAAFRSLPGVPEPGSFVLLGLAGSGLLLGAGRRRS